MADLPKNTTVDNYNIITSKEIVQYASASLNDNEFILYSQAEKRFVKCFTTQTNITPKNGDISIIGSPARAYIFYNNGWYELVLGTDGVNPSGTVVMFTDDNIPDGFLECNGAAVSRTAYPNLFSAIGTRYGAGNGSTTFNVPEIRGEFVRGWDHGRGVDSGRGLGTHQGSTYKSHTHGGNTDSAGAHNHYVPNSNGIGDSSDYSDDEPGDYTADTYRYTDNAGNHNHTITVNNFGGNDTYPKNIALVYCIKT